MIFVTVGNATQGFRRLLDAVEALASSGFFATERVVIQYGNNPDFSSRHCEASAFYSMEQFCDFMEKSDTIICHSGCGTMYHALRLGKIPVVMPRRKKYDEHVNDHQIQLVNALADQKRIVPAHEVADLPEAIRQSRSLSKDKPDRQPPPMIELVGRAIDDLMSHSSQ